MIVLAHGGHWLVQILYAVPLFIMVALLLVGKFRQERAIKRAGRTPPRSPDEQP